jgi:hypothetical protein
MRDLNLRKQLGDFGGRKSFNSATEPVGPPKGTSKLTLAPNKGIYKETTHPFSSPASSFLAKPKKKDSSMWVSDPGAWKGSKHHKESNGVHYTKVKDQRAGYLKKPEGQGVLKNNTNLTSKVDFSKAETTEASKSFVKRYNDPTTRSMMKSQLGVSDDNIDNFILRGLNAEKHVGNKLVPNNARAVSSFNRGSGKDQIFFKDNFSNDIPLEFHERIHASHLDNPMGQVLQKVTGKARDNKQKGQPNGMTAGSYSKLQNYIDKPSETYANFAQFREQLGLKPGEKIDGTRMKKIIKDKKIESNFYKVYDDDKIVKALNTVAQGGGNKNKSKSHSRTV